MSYDYWHAALRGEFGPVHDGQVECGFWRKRTSRSGPFVPVAIWEQDGVKSALVDGHETNPDDIWTYVCRYPVTEEQYRARVETGKWWDEDEAVGESLAHRTDTNNPPTDPRLILEEQIKSALAGVTEYDQITTDEVASKAQSLRSRLLELSGDADKAREKLVRPHLDAEKAINKDWMPLVKEAKAGADAIRIALRDHETREKNKRDAAEAARQKAIQDAEKARQAAEAAGKPAPPQPEIPPPPPPQPVSTQVRGAYGKAASKRVIRVATVADAEAFFPFVRANPAMTDLLAKLAQKAVDAGLNPPGVTVEEKVDVR